MRLYEVKSEDPTRNAQQNLMGRTHYVDPDTLRFHKSRILSCRIHAEGLLLSLIESCAVDYQNTRRGFRYVIFDVCGNVLDRPDLEHACRTRQQAEKEMWAEIGEIDAFTVTRDALASKKKYDLLDYETGMKKLKELKAASK